MKIMRHKTDGKRKLINKRQKLEDGWERERDNGREREREWEGEVQISTVCWVN